SGALVDALEGDAVEDGVGAGVGVPAAEEGDDLGAEAGVAGEADFGLGHGGKGKVKREKGKGEGRGGVERKRAVRRSSRAYFRAASPDPRAPSWPPSPKACPARAGSASPPAASPSGPSTARPTSPRT